MLNRITTFLNGLFHFLNYKLAKKKCKLQIWQKPNPESLDKSELWELELFFSLEGDLVCFWNSAEADHCLWSPDRFVPVDVSLMRHMFQTDSPPALHFYEKADEAFCWEQMQQKIID